MGWSALFGAGLVCGALPVLVLRTRPAVALPAGVVTTWLGVLAADHRRWRELTLCLGGGELDQATAEAVVDELRLRGVRAWTDQRLVDVDGEPSVVPTACCRMADEPLAQTVLARFLEDRATPAVEM